MLGRPNQRYPVVFRDHLRAEPWAARAYEQAKRRLAPRCADGRAYSDAKGPVCDLVMCAAEAWAARTGWSAP